LILIDKNAWSLNSLRPWLPSVLVKRRDERRGRWMYPPGSRVRERWFSPGQVRNQLALRFAEVNVSYLLAPNEARHAIFRLARSTRLFVRWVATGPIGGRNA
jgi:hypothetical protein